MATRPGGGTSTCACTKKAQKNSPLLELPRDIRLRIYSFLNLQQSCDIKLVPRKLTPTLPAKSFKRERSASHDGCCDRIPVNILRVCRTIYEEAHPLIYSRNAFSIEWDSRTKIPFLSFRPDTLRALSGLEVKFNVPAVTNDTCYGIMKHFASFCSLFPNILDLSSMNLSLVLRIESRSDIDVYSGVFLPRVRGLKSCAIRFERTIRGILDDSSKRSTRRPLVHSDEVRAPSSGYTLLPPSSAWTMPPGSSGRTNSGWISHPPLLTSPPVLASSLMMTADTAIPSSGLAPSTNHRQDHVGPHSSSANTPVLDPYTTSRTNHICSQSDCHPGGGKDPNFDPDATRRGSYRHYPLNLPSEAAGIPSFSFDTIAYAKSTAAKMVASATATPAPSQPFRFMDLPRELQALVLYHTDLVPARRQNHYGDGLRVASGRIEMNDTGTCCKKCSPSRAFCFCWHAQHSQSQSWTCICYKFPTAIFLAGRGLNELAREVFLRENRITLAGYALENSQWLQAHGDSLRFLRRLDIQVSYLDTAIWRTNGLDCRVNYPTRRRSARTVAPTKVRKSVGLQSSTRGEYQQLFDLLAQKANLANLALAVDEGAPGFAHANDAHRAVAWTQSQEQSHNAPRRRFMAGAVPFQPVIADAAAPEQPAVRLTQDLRDSGLGGARRFFAFWPCLGAEYEASLERVVKGDDYDGVAIGKVPAWLRDAKFPHDWPAGAGAGTAVTEH